MNDNKQDPGKNSREKAGTKLPPIVTPPIPPVPNRAWTEMKEGDVLGADQKHTEKE